MAEILVIAVVAIVVVGPKDLPKLLRTVGKTISSVKRMAGDFQQQFNDAIEETDLGDLKNIATGKPYNPLDSIKDAANDVKNDINSGLNGDGKDEGGEPFSLFPENETSKRLAQADAKSESSASTSKDSNKGPKKTKSTKVKTGKAKTGKATGKKAATGKTETKNNAPKPAVKKAVNKSAANKTATKITVAKKPVAKKPAKSKTKTNVKSTAT